MMCLKTKRLILRHWRDSDAESLYYCARNPNIGPVAGWPPHESEEYSLNIIRTLLCRPEAYAVLKEDILIGSAELLIHPNGNHWWGEGSAELGYWVGVEYQRRGYATEACRSLIKRAFDDLGIKQIYATFKNENMASRRVLEKLGFEYYTELNNIDYLNRPFREIAMSLNTKRY